MDKKQSFKNHASIFCRSCLTFCEISLLVRFSWIVFINFEKKNRFLSYGYISGRLSW